MDVRLVDIKILGLNFNCQNILIHDISFLVRAFWAQHKNHIG